MSSEASSRETLPGAARQPNWFLHDGDAEIGPLIEVELRTQLANATKAELERMRVRQGSSDWHPATKVLARFKELAQSGVYLKLDEVTHGPFTPERAAQVLRTDIQFLGRLGESLAKVGRHGDWTLAAVFLTSLEQILARKNAPQPLAEAPETPLAKAILIEEPIAPVPSGPVPGGPELSGPVPGGDPALGSKPVRMFTASLVVAEPPPIPSATAASSIASAPPVPEYRRPILKSTTAGNSSNLGKSSDGIPKASTPITAWMIWAAAGLGVVLLLAVGGYFLFRPGSDESLAEAVESDRQGQDSGAGGDVPGSMLTPLSVDNRAVRPPVVTVGMLFRPEFQTVDRPVRAGTAFAARFPGSERPLILSALHLFGPPGGMAQAVPAASLPTIWKGLALTDCVTQRDLGERPGKVLLLADARPYPEASPVGDVVAYFPNSTDGLKTLKLSEEKPKPGDRVWLVSELVSGAGLVHGATVEGFESDYLLYRFDTPSLNLVATSGAPVLNTKHEVIAINAAGGEMRGSVYGIGTPTYKFYEPLARAAGLR